MKKFLLIAAVIIVSYFGCRYCISRLNPFYDAVTNISLSDFESKEQVMEFMNSHLPVKLPEGAKVEKLEYVSWLDFNLKATVVLSPEKAIAYAEKVDAIEVSQKDEHEDTSPYGDSSVYGGYEEDDSVIGYEIKDPPIVGGIVVDPNTGKIEIECSNPPPPMD